MRRVWRIALLIGAVLLLIGGVYSIAYGATYYGVYYVNGEGAPCIYDCSSLYTGVTAVFSGYPIWNPPSWKNVTYSTSATGCTPTTITTYTPQNPPPPCSFPPAVWSADYSRNYGGAFLLALGVVGMALVIRSRAGPNLQQQTSERH